MARTFSRKSQLVFYETGTLWKSSFIFRYGMIFFYISKNFTKISKFFFRSEKLRKFIKKSEIISKISRIFSKILKNLKNISKKFQKFEKNIPKNFQKFEKILKNLKKLENFSKNLKKFEQN